MTDHWARRPLQYYRPVVDTPIVPEPILFLLARGVIFLNFVEEDIIRFLAENGPNSAYDMFEGPVSPKAPRKRGKPPTRTYDRKILPKRQESKALGYDYQRILRHADRLVRIGLLQSEKLKKKIICALTFNGFHVYLQSRSKEAEHLDRAIKSNPELLPFSKYWSEIVHIVRKNMARQSLAKVVSQQIFRSRAKIEKINLQFDSFLVKPSPVFPQIGEKKHNKEFADYLSTNHELRNSYVSYLAVHDVSFLTHQNKWSEIDSILSNLESEKALAFFEKRKIQDSPLFIPGTRLKEFFPKFATIEYFFTGMLMEKLLWKKKLKHAKNPHQRKMPARIRSNQYARPLQVSEVEYEYRKNHEASLLPMLKTLESEIGGERQPFGMRAGFIDLVTFLEIAIGFLAVGAVTTIVHKYFEGLFGDDAKRLGEKHRKQLDQWFSKLESDLERIVQSLNKAYRSKAPITFKRKPMAAAIRINLGPKMLYVVLNHDNVSPKLVVYLPKGIIRALRFLAESSLTQKDTVFQLYFDEASQTWKYLFMPTNKASGRWIDRYADLDTRQIIHVTSQKEFIAKFLPSRNDQLKFLVDPFREAQ